MDLNNLKLPPQIQEKLEKWLPLVNDYMARAETYLGPVAQLAVKEARKIWTQLAEAGITSSIGGTFRHICIVGLNRSELLLQGETQSVFSDNWQDLADNTIRRNMALIFFAPRGLDGLPVNPYLFLMGESENKTEEEETNNAAMLAQQSIGNMPLLDFCRMSPAAPNTVNILIAADTLFHWDVKDNYVLPTTPTSWMRDLDQVLKSYPRTTKAVLYTQWETEILPPSERIRIQRLRDLPLDSQTWLNQPTVQEKYGSYVLLGAVVVAVLAYGGLWLKQRSLQNVTEQLRLVEQQIPRGGQFGDLEKAISEQEKMFRKRELFGVVVKDAARAVQNAKMKADNFEVRVPEPAEPPKNYLVTIEAMRNAYQGWLQEEPIAREIMRHSATFDAIRKPPTTSGFKLEALVEAGGLQKKYNLLAPKAPKEQPVRKGGEEQESNGTPERHQPEGQPAVEDGEMVQ